ncbi:MAG: ABC transporter permease [Alphaproteobacteria bacterium]|nr:ABC transporter permease [Alphaproteobacteria bacterium]
MDAAPPLQRSPRAAPTGQDVGTDVLAGLGRWRLWGLMGWNDIRQRYRRSLIGPFWLSLSMAVMVIALGFLFSTIFKIDIADYLPFLTLGFLAWAFIAQCVTEGCATFIEAEGFIKQMPLPYSTFVYRVVWRNLIILAHNSVVYVVVALIFGIWPGATALLVLPGLVLLVLNAAWLGILVGALCARFRDVPPIVSSLLQMVFFVTPIIWKPELAGDRMLFVDLNPFFHFVELIRAPLLGHAPAAASWLVCIAVTAVGWIATALVFRRCRARIAYWV